MSISVIIPNRGGDKLKYVKQNYDSIFGKDYELIIITQNDNKLFVRGQLFNIGYNFSNFENLLLTDNDIIHFNKLDYELIYNMYKKPFSCWQHIQQCSLLNNKLIYGKLQKNRPGNGGCNFITKTDYKKINGMSNLYLGWGAEDDEYKKRIESEFGEWIKIPNTIGHLTHPGRVNKNQKNTDLNYVYLNDFEKRNYKIDGLNETKYDLEKVEVKDNVINVYVKNIRVNENFEYYKLFEKHFKV